MTEPVRNEPQRPKRQRSAMDMLKEFLREQSVGRSELDLATLTTAARLKFKNDEAFINALFNGAFGQLVQDALRAVQREGRDSLVTLERGFVTQEHLDSRSREILGAIYESTGDGRRKSVLSMTRPDLLYSIESRAKQIAGLTRWNGFQAELAEGLETDEETVGEHYSDAEFEAIIKRHFGRTEDIPPPDED